MPCAESRLIEKPQVKNEPASCQNASVCSASPAVTRSTGGALAPAFTAAPSPERPPPPREEPKNRVQRREAGSKEPAPSNHAVRSQALVGVRHVTPGTRTTHPRRHP